MLILNVRFGNIYVPHCCYMKSWSSPVVRIKPLTLGLLGSNPAGGDFVQKFFPFQNLPWALPRCKTTKVDRVSLQYREQSRTCVGEFEIDWHQKVPTGVKGQSYHTSSVSSI